MTVVLEPPLTRSAAWRVPGRTPPAALAVAPRYLRTRTMGRWHRPRSGTHHPDTGRDSYLLWCGQTLGWQEILSAEAVPDGEMACGTCEGRAIGAGQDDWPGPGGPELLFEPRRLTPPRHCPGSRSEHLYEVISQHRDILRCLACREIVKGRGYGWRYGPENHEPGAGLVPGCPFHAWQDLVIAGGQAICACKAGETP